MLFFIFLFLATAVASEKSFYKTFLRISGSRACLTLVSAPREPAAEGDSGALVGRWGAGVRSAGTRDPSCLPRLLCTLVWHGPRGCAEGRCSPGSPMESPRPDRWGETVPLREELAGVHSVLFVTAERGPSDACGPGGWPP